MQALRAIELKVQHLVQPLGLDAPQPELSWLLKCCNAGERGQRQTAYRVMVAASLVELQCNQGTLWDTDKVGLRIFDVCCVLVSRQAVATE